MTRPLALLLLLALTLAFPTAGCTRMRLFKRTEPARTAAAGPQVGFPAPEIDGEDLFGEPIKLSDYRGQVVMVTFWASWCKPCRDLIPHERQLAERFKDAPFVVLGVNFDDDIVKARRVVSIHGIAWRNVQTGGDDHSIKKRWPIEALPTTYLIDAQGIVRHIRVGRPCQPGSRPGAVPHAGNNTA